jgi:hypothetical protein
LPLLGYVIISCLFELLFLLGLHFKLVGFVSHKVVFLLHGEPICSEVSFPIMHILNQWDSLSDSLILQLFQVVLYYNLLLWGFWLLQQALMPYNFLLRAGIELTLSFSFQVLHFLLSLHLDETGVSLLLQYLNLHVLLITWLRLMCVLDHLVIHKHLL